MASIVKRVGRIVHVRMDDGKVYAMPDSMAPPEATEETEEPNNEVDKILHQFSEKIKNRPNRIKVPSPAELTSVGLFRFAALSRIRKARAKRRARERLDARS